MAGINNQQLDAQIAASCRRFNSLARCSMPSIHTLPYAFNHRHFTTQGCFTCRLSVNKRTLPRPPVLGASLHHEFSFLRNDIQSSFRSQFLTFFWHKQQYPGFTFSAKLDHVFCDCHSETTSEITAWPLLCVLVYAFVLTQVHRDTVRTSISAYTASTGSVQRVFFCRKVATWSILTPSNRVFHCFPFDH